MSADRIERIELFHVDVPLPTPFFPVWIPGYPQTHRRSTLLRVTTRAGAVGLATGVAFEREREGLGDFIGPFLLGLDPTDPVAAADRLRQSAFLGWRNAWMELAFWDLAAQIRGVPLWELIAERIGAPRRERAPTAIAAYASFGEHREPKVRAESLERAQRVGFRSAKIALRGIDEAADRAQVLAARAFVGDHFELMVHAHQSWSVSLVEDVSRWSIERALRFAEFLAEQKIRWLQEPLHGEELDGLAALTAEAPVPIAAGDIAAGYASISSLVRGHCASILTPDVTITGLDATARVLGRCAEQGIGFSPSCYGGGLSVLANLHALAAWGAVESGTADLRLEFPWEPPAMLPELRDALLTQAVHVDADGTVPVPTAPGIGASIDDKALRRYAHQFYTVTPVRFAVSSARRSGLRQTAAFARRDNPSPKKAVGSNEDLVER